jgi:mannose-6-phosphate isomerase-like protein (cupin superfamily)
MTRSETSHLSSLEFDLPSGSATMILPDPDTRPNNVVTRIPAKSQWETPLHWHETHTEYFRVTKGYAVVTVGNDTNVFGPDDGVVEILPYTIHAFSRADNPNWRHLLDQNAAAKKRFEGLNRDWQLEDVDVEEWTSPADGAKEIFFRNGISFFADEIRPLICDGVQWGNVPQLAARGLQSMAFQSYMDNYMLICGNLGRSSSGSANAIGRYTTYAVLGISRIATSIFGWDLWQKSYVPRRLWVRCGEAFGSAPK